MAELLKDSEMDQLEQWIGAGPKTFTLLYKISRDGCNANVFHQKCNNQGATVTVLYNQQGTVYGGYTSQSWTSSGTYLTDGQAFLFRLNLNGKFQPIQFPRTGNGHDVLCNATYGPTFGGGNDLLTFSNTVKNSRGIFALNGSMNIGSSYNPQGQNANNINNGTMYVTDLEVYKVTDGKRKPKVVEPWRKTPHWNEKLLDKLMEDVISFKPLPELKISQARILLIGPVGAGKSSFFNTINSIFRGRITQRANSGSAEQSLTTVILPMTTDQSACDPFPSVTIPIYCDNENVEAVQIPLEDSNKRQYNQYEVRVRSGAALNFRLCDTRGLEESQGMDVLECNYLLDGHVPDFYQFNPSSPITPETDKFISKPTLGDKIHCVAFVLDSTTLDVISTKILQKIKQFQSLMNQKGIPQAVILTKVDRLCAEVDKDISKTFKSKAVHDIVEKTSQTLGLPRGNVLPVKNYENEMELDGRLNILALLALRQVLNFAEDYMENLLDRVRANVAGVSRLSMKD